jgi:hypothetical protein
MAQYTMNELLKMIRNYLNDNGLVIDDFDADAFMIHKLNEGVRISEVELATAIEHYYINH